MPFSLAILDASIKEGHKMASQSAPREVKQHFSGVKHFLKGVEKNLGGVKPLTPSENPLMM